MTYRGTIRFINEQKNVAVVDQDMISERVAFQSILGKGNGIANQFFGSIKPFVITSSGVFSVNDVAITASVSSAGVISGAGINSAGVNYLNASTGACAICISGTPGTPSTITGTVNLINGIDLSQDAYPITIVIDGNTYLDIELGYTNYTNAQCICNDINKIIKNDVATLHTSTGISKLKLTGVTAKTGQNIVCTGPGATALGITGTSVSAANPVGAMPLKGQTVSINCLSNYANDDTSLFTYIKGDFSAVSVGDSIAYTYDLTENDPNIDDKEVTIS